ncbi:YjgF-like protein [Flagelloscypha sp. PMI_526]|nr:YjgF-like protein [Flagelloscypha sp. PMI_526]
MNTNSHSRAICRGPFIFVSGTTSARPQTQKLLYLNLVRKMILYALGLWFDEMGIPVLLDLFCKASLGEVGPAANMVVSAKFVHQDMLVEFEAEALIDGSEI